MLSPGSLYIMTSTKRSRDREQKSSREEPSTDSVDYLDAVISTSTFGPSCSKLTMSLVNDSLKFTSSDTQIC